MWLVRVGYLTGQRLSNSDVARWAPPALLPLAAVAFWVGVVARGRSPLGEPRIVATLVFVAVTSVFCGIASVDDPNISAGLLSAVVTGLGMVGLFVIPTAFSRQLPDVIRQRSRSRPDAS
ncbi:hypothetical protein OG981_53670 [Streptomyces mirabilis]|uniref:hypothetical protein n=1 Tax=Streptomyces mirabilis TaxID=68239 RepID=UPI002E227D54